MRQVEEAGGGDVRAERGNEGDQEPAPGQPRGAEVAEPTPRGDQEQVDADRVGPSLPAGLSGRRGDVVQVGEGQRPGNHGLDQYGVRADVAGHVFTSFDELGPGGAGCGVRPPRRDAISGD